MFCTVPLFFFLFLPTRPDTKQPGPWLHILPPLYSPDLSRLRNNISFLFRLLFLLFVFITISERVFFNFFLLGPASQRCLDSFRFRLPPKWFNGLPKHWRTPPAIQKTRPSCQSQETRRSGAQSSKEARSKAQICGGKSQNKGRKKRVSLKWNPVSALVHLNSPGENKQTDRQRGSN